MIHEEKDVNDLTDRGLKSNTSTFHNKPSATNELTQHFSELQITKDFNLQNKSELKLEQSPVLLPNP